MTLRGRRDIKCGEDRATVETDPSVPQGHRQPAAPVSLERRTPGAGRALASAFSSVRTPGGGRFFISNWNRPDCLAQKANTPGHGVAEPSCTVHA